MVVYIKAIPSGMTIPKLQTLLHSVSFFDFNNSIPV